MPKLRILPDKITLHAHCDEDLMSVLQNAGIFLDAPCGGNGRCGKCKILIDGKESLACQTAIKRDITLTIPARSELHVLCEGQKKTVRLRESVDGYLLAFDIGTTSIVCFLLDGRTGEELASSSMLNPQTSFGADVISRIRTALQGGLDRECQAVRDGMTSLIESVCRQAGILPDRIHTVSVVGNPAMQQLFLHRSPENLARIPFAPVLTEARTVPCIDYLSVCPNAGLLIVPDISGYIGADTIGCILSTEMYRTDRITLMVDIGTNGEMVLGSRDRMIACSTSAGPALEGANIHFGMRGTDGAIDRVRLDGGKMRCSVIGGKKAAGICGSGLIDAAAAALDAGILNKRGRIRTTAEVSGQRVLYLTDEIYLTQDDIRQIQLAKGAIRAGIELMVRQLGLTVTDIEQVLLAGAFGSYLYPANACRIGLLPEELKDRIIPVGNAAGGGAKMLACDPDLLSLTQTLTKKVEFLELAELPEFSRTFAKSMNFQERTP